MLKIIVSVIVGIILSIVVNLVSNYFVPTTSRKKTIFSLLVGLVALSIMIALMPDSVEQNIALFINKQVLSSPFAWIYVAIVVVSLFFISRFLIRKLRIFFTITPPDDQEKAYLQSLIKDLEQHNRKNRWSDKFYIEIDTELREKVSDYEIKSYFYLVKPINQKSKQQEYNNLTNIEKIDSTRGTTFKSLGTALDRATDNAVVVISPPGGGKTVSLRNLAIKLAKQRLNGEIQQLPIFINLGYYIGVEHEGNPQKFDDFLENYFAHSGYRTILANMRWEELLKKGQCMFFLDGLDEIPRRRHEYFARTKLIEDFTRLWPATKFVISCRELDYERDLKFQQILIKPFDRRHIIRFLRKYFSMTDGKSLIKELENNQPMFDICKNPFYLNLVCNYMKFTNRLPHNKTQLFRLIIDRLIDRETARMGIDEKEAFKNSFLNSMIYLASVLAFRNMSTSITMDEYKLELREFAEREIALDMLSYAIKGDIIEISESNTIRFTHNRFQEYFSSFEVVRNFRSPNFHFPKEFFVNIWWRETVLFVAGLDSNPSDFVNLVFSASHDYKHSNPAIERIIKLDISILAFDSVFSSLEFNDFKLYSEIRDHLISYYRNSNILEKAKILTTISQDQSKNSHELIEKALDDESDWISERAFFIINEGELRLQMKPKRVLIEFWRFFISGRIFFTLPAVLKASRRSVLLRSFLPIYFVLIVINVLSVAFVLYLFYVIFNFLTFDLKYTFTVDCLNCLISIGFATALIVYTLTREEHIWVKRFLIAAPLSMIAIYDVFNSLSDIQTKFLEYLLAVILWFIFERFLKFYYSNSFVRLLIYILIIEMIFSMTHYTSEGITVHEQVNITVSKITSTAVFPYSVNNNNNAPQDYLDVLLPLIYLIGIISYIVYMLIKQIIIIRYISKYHHDIQKSKGTTENEEIQFEKLIEMFKSLKSFVWAQKMLLQEVIEYNSHALKKTHEEQILYLLKLAEYLEVSPLKDAVFQKLEDEERSYRREL